MIRCIARGARSGGPTLTPTAGPGRTSGQALLRQDRHRISFNPSPEKRGSASARLMPRSFEAAPTRPPSLRCAPLRRPPSPSGRDGASGEEALSPYAHSLRDAPCFVDACTLLLSL